MRRRALTQRPEAFRVDPTHPLARGLVHAYLGGGPRSLKYQDDSPCRQRKHGTLVDRTPERYGVSHELGRRYLEFNEPGYVGTSVVNADIVGAEGIATISFWFKPTVPVSEQMQNRIVMSIDGLNTTGERAWDFRWGEKQKDDLYFWAGIGSLGCGLRYDLIVDTWFHIAVAIEENGPVRGYLDGILNQETTATGPFDYIDVPLKLSARDCGNNGSPCVLSDVLFHNRRLSLGEISVLANRADPMLSGMILPAKRRMRVPPSFAFTPAWAHGINQQIGTGLGI